MSRPTLHRIVVCLSLASCESKQSPSSGDEPAHSTPTDSTPDSEPPPDTDLTDTGTPPDSGDPADNDGDGFAEADGDCADTDPLIHPGATDDCYDAVDEDCDGGPRDCDPLPDIMLDDADTAIRPANGVGHLLEDFAHLVVALGDIDADGEVDFGTMWSGDVSPSELDMVHKQAWVFSGPIDTGSLVADDKAVAIVRQDNNANERLTTMANAGDVDGDGYDDLVFGAWDSWGGVELFLGPLVGDITVAQHADVSWPGSGGHGWSVDGAFDFDGDGNDDLVVGSPWVLDGAGAAYWISGADLAFNSFSEAHAILDGLATDLGRGWAVSGLGDVDGDGLDDLATGAYTGEVFVYTGGALSCELDSRDAAHASFSIFSGHDQYGKEVDDGGDFNNDGYADLLITATATGAGTVHVIAGPMDTSGEAAALALATFEGESPGDDFGHSADGSMDVNLDGNTDLLVGAPWVRDEIASGGGAAYLFYGPMTGTIDTGLARCAMRGETRYLSSGWSVAMIGDQYGDGAPEILIGETGSAGGMLSIVSSEHL